MGLNDTPSGERLHIGFFGMRNAGKSSLVNAVTGQELAVVSDVAGTTTDPVKKAMELLPLGPVMIIDTPGIDDEGQLGELRVRKTKETLAHTDIAVLVTDARRGMPEPANELAGMLAERKIPYIIARNKCDLLYSIPPANDGEIYVSALRGTGINELKEMLGRFAGEKKEKPIAADLLSEGGTAVLVVPIDKAAPKGRLILPQQQVIRDLLDHGMTAFVCRDSELSDTLKRLSAPPDIVITDSQVFGKVSKAVPADIPLTSFSILMARHKGSLDIAVRGAATLDKLKDGDAVLISEGCTHHRQCEDIGTVKLPNWISGYTGKKLRFEFSSGGTFPDDLTGYALVVHCGGCTLNEKEMNSRMERALSQNVPITNYGIAVAHIHGILQRSIAPIPGTADLLK
ncbi:MAG: [FeFe] hydrogenase H-cluster maturation GTPase HydF [Ruminiclostridium sp.]|nr:[FeFe] hydrogenase H-cluster maturation GTPase HydF [Ruminiclostridium sp.]